MKITINKVLKRIEFVKWIRTEFTKMPFAEAIFIADNPPYVIEGLSKSHSEEIKHNLEGLAECLLESDYYDDDYTIWNQNINPPPEYVAAMAWHDTLSPEEQAHIEQIVAWRSRPAVC